MGMVKLCAPYAGMVMAQVAYGCSNILTKVCLERGQNQLVFVVYRHLIGMFILGPLAYAFERNKRPTLSFSVVMKIFLFVSLGTTVNLNVYYVGLKYTSATVASALGNVVPGLTFLVAVLFRVEKVSFRSKRGWAKVVGTLICISGALIFTFWRGGYFFHSLLPSPLLHIHPSNSKKQDHWIKGSLLILISQVISCACLFLQAEICKVYPARLSLNTLVCFFASLQSLVLALIFDRTLSPWKLEWNVQLLSLMYSGIVNTALISNIQTWVISEKGPVFCAMFSPLVVLIVGMFSAILFAERLHLSSMIGGVLIIVGLYAVLWGRSKEEDNNICYMEGKSSITKTDLNSDNHPQPIDLISINSRTLV